MLKGGFVLQSRPNSMTVIRLYIFACNKMNVECTELCDFGTYKLHARSQDVARIADRRTASQQTV